jgi:transcription initiation factor IIF auxiliary subunit
MPMKLKLRLRNQWKYKGDDWWEWKAFVDDEGSGDLQEVEYVKYVLHSSFAEPVRRVDTRKGGFPLESEGWGEFKLTAYAHTRDKRDLKLTHDLKLEYEPPTGISA